MRRALDPALPGGDPVLETRRLAAGDWVHVSGPAPSIQGLGKIVDGEYAPRDAVLLQARVETARGTYWFSPTALLRVEPEAEAHFADAVLEASVLPDEQAGRVRRDLEAFRKGTLVYVRSPGLLDRLWSFGEVEGERPLGKLVALFDEGSRVIAARRQKAQVEDARVRRSFFGEEHGTASGVNPRRAAWSPPAPGIVAEAEPFSATAPVEAPRSVVISRMLSQLDVDALRSVSRRAGVDFISVASVGELRQKIADSPVELGAVLDALTPPQASLAVKSLGEGQLLGQAMRLVNAEKDARKGRETVAPWASTPLALAAAGADLVRQTLGRDPLLGAVIESLGSSTLERVVKGFAVGAEAPIVASTASQYRDFFVGNGIPLSSLLIRLSYHELSLAARGLGCADGPDSARLIDSILAENHRRGGNAPRSGSALLGQPSVAKAGSIFGCLLVSLDDAALRAVARCCDVPVDPSWSVAEAATAIAEAEVDWFVALWPLGFSSLAPICKLLELPTTGTPGDLRIRILDSADRARRALVVNAPRVDAEPVLEDESGEIPALTAATASATRAPADSGPIWIDDLKPTVLARLSTAALTRVAEAADVPTWDGPLDADLQARIEKAAVSLEKIAGALTEHELRDACLGVGLEGDGDAATLRARLIAADLEID